MLEPYGGTRIPTPNFARLAKRTVAFDNHYVGSLPCMPCGSTGQPTSST
eukprot:gene39284-53105_t